MQLFEMRLYKISQESGSKHFRIGSKRLEWQMVQSDMALTVLKGVVRDELVTKFSGYVKVYLKDAPNKL